MPRAAAVSLHLALALVAVLFLVANASASDEDRQIVVHVDRGGFRWSDAAIGLLAGIGISVVTASGVALARLRGAEARTPRKGEQE